MGKVLWELSALVVEDVQDEGMLQRYQRRTSRRTAQFGAVVNESAGRAGSRLLNAGGSDPGRDAVQLQGGKAWQLVWD